MTVQQLIEILKSHEPTRTVVIRTAEGYDEVEDVAARPVVRNNVFCDYLPPTPLRPFTDSHPIVVSIE